MVDPKVTTSRPNVLIGDDDPKGREVLQMVWRGRAARSLGLTTCRRPS